MQKNGENMKNIGIGLIGGGYMGKRHAVALQAVGALFNTNLRPVCEMICTTSEKGARKKAQELGFKNSTHDWKELLENPKVEAIIIASPQETHREIAELAFNLGKPVLCEKPLGASLEDAQILTKLAEEKNVVNMLGFNYIRTPVTQFARELINNGELGEITYVRAEHVEDFYCDPNEKATWRTQGKANGTMGDLAPHIINAMHYLLGPITELCANIDHVHKSRPSNNSTNEVTEVTNDDQGQFICKFRNGASGHLVSSRIATGRKMGLTYEITGTKGSIKFVQEDQNALWLYKADEDNAKQGFRKILSNPSHPDYGSFCQGPGHGTGYQDQLIIEAKDFLKAIETGVSTFPTFKDGLEVSSVIDAVWKSHEKRAWVQVEL